jgi:hypothetical protein
LLPRGRDKPQPNMVHLGSRMKNSGQLCNERVALDDAEFHFAVLLQRRPECPVSTQTLWTLPISAAWSKADSLCSKRVIPSLIQMYGPAVRCKRFSSIWQCGLASMYPVSDWSCSWLPPRRRRLILSQTLAGKLSYVIDSSSLCAVPLFVPGGRSFVPACAQTRRAQARQGWPSRGLASRFRAARPCLDGREHGVRITLDGTPSHRSLPTRRRGPR